MIDGDYLVSIITPSYNHAAYIRQTIESVLQQDYPHVEHIVVDGGSTDGTVSILREYEERFPGRVRWISEPDEGQSDALNKGIALARGTFIGWQNSDDYYLPNVFREPIEYLCAHPAVAVVYSRCLLVDAEMKVTGQLPVGRYDFGRLLRFNYIPNQAAFIRRDALLACGGVTTTLHYVMDQDLWLRLGLSYRIEYLPGIRGVFRLTESAKTNTGLLKSRLESVYMIDRVLAFPDLDPAVHLVARAALARHLMDALLVALALNQDVTARELFSRALTAEAPLQEWDYYCKRLFMRRVITETWYAHLGSDAVQTIPSRTITFLREANLAATGFSRRMLALSWLFQALDLTTDAPTLNALPYVVRALGADRHWLCYPASVVALLRLTCGNHAVAALHPCFRSIRRLADWVSTR